MAFANCNTTNTAKWVLECTAANFKCKKIGFMYQKHLENALEVKIRTFLDSDVRHIHIKGKGHPQQAVEMAQGVRVG